MGAELGSVKKSSSDLFGIYQDFKCDSENPNQSSCRSNNLDFFAQDIPENQKGDFSSKRSLHSHFLAKPSRNSSKKKKKTKLQEWDSALRKNPNDHATRIKRLRYYVLHEGNISKAEKDIQFLEKSGEFQAEIYFYKAEVYYLKQDLKAALEIYLKAHEEFPEDPRFLENLGHTCEYLEKIPQAIEAYRKLIQLNPTPENFIKLANALGRVNRSQILPTYNQGIEVCEENSEKAGLYIERGYYYLSLDQVQLAIDDFQKALKLKANSLHILEQLADIHQSDQPALAIKYLDAYIDKEKSSPHVYELRAKLHQRLGHHQKAEDDFKKAKELEGIQQGYIKKKTRRSRKRKVDLETRVKRLIDQNQTLKAKQILDSQEKDDFDVDKWIRIIKYALEKKQNQFVEAILDKAISFFPYHPEVNHLLGYIHYQKGSHQAHKYFSLAVRFDPDHAAAHAYLSMIILDDRHDSEKALELSNRALLIDADHVVAQGVKGRILFAQEKPEQALHYLSQAISNDTDDPEVYLCRGTIWLDGGFHQKAYQDLKKALVIKVDP